MIVQPNFLDHWKTRLLVAELGGDELAPMYVLRLWGHCQTQKNHRFPKMSAQALSAITCAKCANEALWLALQTSGFIKVKGDVVTVHQWDEYNQSLVTSWKNGKKGGRKTKNPAVTRGFPVGNPPATQRGGDREDKIEKRSVVCVAPQTAQTTTPHHDIRLVENHHNEIAARWPKHDVMQCYRRAQRYVRNRRGADAVVTVGWFEASWMPGEAEAKRGSPQQTPSAPISEPPSTDEVNAERQRWLAMPEPEDGTLDHALWKEARCA